MTFRIAILLKNMAFYIKKLYLAPKFQFLFSNYKFLKNHFKKSTHKKWVTLLYKNGDAGRIRTCDRQLRRLLLYPAELLHHTL
jgi:hypothetical protein